ncbi:hypothetical protein AVEN_190365-1 [Araneus ventricosus]|uniref:Uncharacterized protein n=1 Tax=Araneus ventricosus TaxID=182803 RepID=A0A4Y2QKT8_ARAVE|nr:hypothetical protein AVEN_233734-1 [Araneus ventricosus]GBN63819.1 hypothetical protein AVEN_190365-1 [Araneus ventricosus]
MGLDFFPARTGGMGPEFAHRTLESQLRFSLLTEKWCILHYRGPLVISVNQHEGYFGTDLVILNLGQMTRTTPELAPPSPNFHATPTGGRLTTTFDLTCNRPHTRRIFSGIGSRTWNPPAPKPRPYH